MKGDNRNYKKIKYPFLIYNPGYPKIKYSIMKYNHGSQITSWKTMGSFMKFGDSLRFFEILKTDGSLILIFFLKYPKPMVL
jgi:hypothetical protein